MIFSLMHWSVAATFAVALPPAVTPVPPTSPVVRTALDTLAGDSVVWNELRSNMGDLRGKLPELIKARADSARAQGRTLFVEVGATWCGPCLELEHNLKNADMKDAFANTSIVHLDVNEWDIDSDLPSIGLTGGVMPMFGALDTNGKVIAELKGVTDAPGLKKFFTAHLWSAKAKESVASAGSAKAPIPARKSSAKR